MTLTFDWFLPTSGDGRTIYGRGHSLPIAQAQALPIPADRSHDERYARTGEFLAIVRGAWSGQLFDFSGRYYQVEQATVMQPPDPLPGIRGGAGTALVGSHEQVADLIEEYAALGISEFILSGYPHLEEAYWFGEGVLPELERRGRWQHPAPVRHAPQTITPFAPTHARSAV